MKTGDLRPRDPDFQARMRALLTCSEALFPRDYLMVVHVALLGDEGDGADIIDTFPTTNLSTEKLATAMCAALARAILLTVEPGHVEEFTSLIHQQLDQNLFTLRRPPNDA